MPRVTAPPRAQKITYIKQGGPAQARNNRVITIIESNNGTQVSTQKISKIWLGGWTKVSAGAHVTGADVVLQPLQRTTISVSDQLYANITTPIGSREAGEVPKYSMMLDNVHEDAETSDWNSNCATVVGDDNLSQHSFSSSTTNVDPTEDLNYRLLPNLLLQGPWTDIRPHLFHPDSHIITYMVISTQDSSPFQFNEVVKLPTLQKFHLQTRHPIDLTRFWLPGIRSLALLAVDVRDASFMEEVAEVMKEAKEWITKPSKLLLGLNLSFNQWKPLLAILGEHTTSLQIAVPGGCPEDYKLASFLKDEFGTNERRETLPFANPKDIRFHDTRLVAYSDLVLQSAQETLGIHTRG